MSTTDFIREYGYYAIVVGTFFEGELIMLAAGVAAGAGMLSLPGVIAAGMLGIFASDTLCFLLGRYAGGHLKRWFPGIYSRLGRVFGLIERHDEKLIVFFQFLPGLCTVTPVAFGLSKISTVRFMALDFLGNAFWTLIFSLGGYAFGSAFERIVRDARDWEWLVVGGVVVVGLVIWLVGRALSGRWAKIG